MVTQSAPGKSFLVAAVVLAAGAGRRFGGGKILSPFGEGRLVDGAVAAALASPAGEVVVVTGAEAIAVAGHLQARWSDARLRQVHAPDWAEGMSASLKAGLAAVTGADAVLVFLGDMPRIPHGILADLVETVRAGAPAAAPVHRGQRGHPVVLGRDLLSQAATLSGDQGAARLLTQVVLLETDDDGVLFDVDVPSQPVTSPNR